MPEDPLSRPNGTRFKQRGCGPPGDYDRYYPHLSELFIRFPVSACDKHGWILGYSVHPGNEHDSRTFKALYDKIKHFSPDMIIADAGYKTPAIAHRLLEDGIEPLFPHKRPMTKEGMADADVSLYPRLQKAAE